MEYFVIFSWLMWQPSILINILASTSEDQGRWDLDQKGKNHLFGESKNDGPYNNKCLMSKIWFALYVLWQFLLFWTCYPDRVKSTIISVMINEISLIESLCGKGIRINSLLMGNHGGTRASNIMKTNCSSCCMDKQREILMTMSPIEALEPLVIDNFFFLAKVNWHGHCDK